MFVGVGTQAAAAFASKNSMLRGEKVQILMRICPHYFKSTLNPNVLTSNSPAEFREHSFKKNHLPENNYMYLQDFTYCLFNDAKQTLMISNCYL